LIVNYLPLLYLYPFVSVTFKQQYWLWVLITAFLSHTGRWVDTERRLSI